MTETATATALSDEAKFLLRRSWTLLALSLFTGALTLLNIQANQGSFGTIARLTLCLAAILGGFSVWSRWSATH